MLADAKLSAAWLKGRPPAMPAAAATSAPDSGAPAATRTRYTASSAPDTPKLSSTTILLRHVPTSLRHKSARRLSLANRFIYATR